MPVMTNETRNDVGQQPQNNNEKCESSDVEGQLRIMFQQTTIAEEVGVEDQYPMNGGGSKNATHVEHYMNKMTAENDDAACGGSLLRLLE